MPNWQTQSQIGPIPIAKNMFQLSILQFEKKTSLCRYFLATAYIATYHRIASLFAIAIAMIAIDNTVYH